MPRRDAEVSPAELLRQRRTSIDEVTETLEALGPGADPAKVASVMRSALQQPILGFLSELPGGVERLVTQSVEDYVRFSPNPASNAQTAAGLVRILLLQNVDLLWWDDEPDFATVDDFSRADMVDLVDERRAGRVRFSFGIASDRLPRRSGDFAVQRLMPWREPRGPGLTFTAIRPAMLGLLNEAADRVTATAPAGTPPIRVNSIVRTIDHQLHLKTLGFSALLPSVHCRGWAADIEVDWMARFGADDAVRTVLSDYLDRGVLNVIDEGRAWHVCLDPADAPRYDALGRA
jgi:hypothetical protein